MNSAAQRAAQTKAFAQAKFEAAEQALQQRDLTAARKLIDEADAADPNQAPIMNLRGEVLLEQKDYDQAENEFKKAQKADPSFRDAQYNLAQVPFKKKEYTKARERFETLFAATAGTDKDRAAQLIKYKIYLTLLLEDKDSRAQKMMEQFQFTGDTPALYYAQAAWEFKHGNPTKANDWVTSARKIYPLALNTVFADTFFDLGWLQVPSLDASAPTLADGSQPEMAPSIEPTPIPSMTLAKNDAIKNADPLTLAAQGGTNITGAEATTSSTANQSPTASNALAAASPSVETPVASTASPAASRPVVANAETENPTNSEESTTAVPNTASTSSSPATVLAPPQIVDWSQPSFFEKVQRFGESNGLLIVALVLAGGLLAWAFRYFPGRSGKTASGGNVASVDVSDSDDAESVGAVNQLVMPTRLAGGPPQVSLQLRASEPALRRAVMPLGKSGRTNGAGNGTTNGNGHGHGFGAAIAAAPEAAERAVADEPYSTPETSYDEGVGQPVEAKKEEDSWFKPVSTEATQPISEPEVTEEFEPAFAAADEEPTYADAEASAYSDVEEPAYAHVETAPVYEEASAAAEPEEFSTEAIGFDEPAFVTSEATTEDSLVTASAAHEEEFEPIGQGQPVPYLTPAPIDEISPSSPETAWAPSAPVAAVAAGLAGIGALRHSVSPSVEPEVVSNEPTAQQPTTQVTMPQPTQPTPAPAIRTAPASPVTGAAPQPSGGAPASSPMPGGMHTAVQLTFSFEIASLQLTPSFKMSALQLKPTSKIVTMRLAPSQHPQPAMNLQVTFEIASVQLAGNSIGVIRLTPSQQQRPGISSSPSFAVAGLQLVSGADVAPVQITPSQQGGASVHVTGGFQIATVEFSPSFEIASIILNATSRNVSVQLPGSGPSAVEGAPVFEIGSVQLGNNGEISMMQLNQQGAAAKRA